MTNNGSISAQSIFQVYPSWDTDSPSVPVRSHLFRLEPIGVGTPEVECLTSYIARLAAEHCVSPRKLLCREVLAPTGKNTTHYSTSSEFSARLVNGMGQLAKLTVDTLERLTARDDLRYTTTLIWENVLSTHLLLRKKKAWCPICYGEWLNEEKPLYDPLIWTFKIISICPRHHEPLCQLCRYCNRQLPFLTTFSYPGFCSNCRTWLGTMAKGGNNYYRELASSLEKTRQISEAHSVGEFLSSAINFDSLPRLHDFMANLAQCVDQSAHDNINLFSDLVGIWSGTVRRLLAGETKLSLKMLYQLCSRLNVSSHDLLSNKGSKVVLKKRQLTLERDIYIKERVESQKINRIQVKQLKTGAPVSWDKVAGKLQAALKENPPPSMEYVARRMGYDPRRIKRYFPKLCKQIISQYWEYINNKHPPPAKVQKVLHMALSEQPPPSLQCVLRRLGCRDTGYYYYYNYQDLCLAVTQRYKNHRNNPFNKDADGAQLQSTLNEYPPPSFSEVAKRFGHTREFVRRKFPEISKAIISRHLYYQAALRKEKAEQLRRLVKAAAQQIASSGLYVSEARVREYLRQHLSSIGREELFKQALREVKLEMGLVK